MFEGKKNWCNGKDLENNYKYDMNKFRNTSIINKIYYLLYLYNVLFGLYGLNYFKLNIFIMFYTMI